MSTKISGDQRWEDTRSIETENEHDRRAVCQLKSGTIVGSIVVDTSQRELSSVSFSY